MSKVFTDLDRGLYDAYLSDLFIAYKDCSKLYKETTSPKAKTRVANIQLQISLALHKIAHIGIHSERELKELEKQFQVF